MFIKTRSGGLSDRMFFAFKTSLVKVFVIVK